MESGTRRGAVVLRVGHFAIEIRRSWAVLLTAYLIGGCVTALAGGHTEVGGRDGIVVAALAFAVLAFAAALFHEVGHALAGAAFGRRAVGLVLKAGAAVRIEEAAPGSRGATAWAESLVALSGPLASALIGLAYYNVSSAVTSPFAWAALLAFVDGLVNLVPVVANSDGNRVLLALTRSRPRLVD
ncbi:Peptidase family M50 [Nocardioides terrae]|uniref:Peptidase family M50 n=1 Tax=Nocardioides terrae TaxID=574651 RepID=A0A1I1LC47_9ACTN|nr:M50 family metallopeptidase [Nocardioides terrae]SFC67953.1 Peptidase family M50 [Nocardioides terrae]